MSVSLGLGLTNDCNLSCPHCYRPKSPVRHLPLEDVKRVCGSLDVGGVNLGTGENALHPRFQETLDWLLGSGYRVSLTSNGLSIAGLSSSVLRQLSDVEISIDFPDRDRFDQFRGSGAWAAATGALQRCARLGVQTTLLAVLMRANHRELPALARVAGERGALMRLNVYQSVYDRRFTPTWQEYWYAVGDLLFHTRLLACSEPVVAAAAGLPLDGVSCGRTSVRVTPAGRVLPCTYWPETSTTVDDLTANPQDVMSGEEFRKLSTIPVECDECPQVAVCRGGCASRRMLAGGVEQRDPYCPFTDELPVPIEARSGEDPDRLHTANVCTLLVSPR